MIFSTRDRWTSMNRVRWLVVRFAGILLALQAACVTVPTRTTWLDDEFDGVAHHRPSTSRWRRGARVPLTAEFDPRAAASPGELEDALRRFTALHRKRWPSGASAQPRGKPGRWPDGLSAVWRAMLADLKLGLRSRPVAEDRRLLLQMRVTLEAELERAVKRYGPVPSDILRDTRRVFKRVRHHLATAPQPPPRPANAPIELTWPVSPQILTSRFGYRRDPIAGRSTFRFHAGIDLGGRRGTSVVAAADGRIIDAGWFGGHGRSIRVQHADGIVTVYSHLRRVLVREGQRVTRGEVIGLMGSTGRSTGPHLHFEVRRNNVPMDPLELLQRSRHAARADPTDTVAASR